MNHSIMANLKIVLSLFLVLGMVSSDFLHKSDIEFRFTKIKDGSNEFEYEWVLIYVLVRRIWYFCVYRYDLSDGEIYRAETFMLSKTIYVMIGKDQIYYAEFTDDELKSEKTFSKADVRIGVLLIIPLETFH